MGQRTLPRQNCFILAPTTQTNKDDLSLFSSFASSLEQEPKWRCASCNPIANFPIVNPLGNPGVLGIVRGRSLVVDIAVTRLDCSISSGVHHHLYSLRGYSSCVSHLIHSCNLLAKLTANKAAPGKIPSNSGCN